MKETWGIENKKDRSVLWRIWWGRELRHGKWGGGVCVGHSQHSTAQREGRTT